MDNLKNRGKVEKTKRILELENNFYKKLVKIIEDQERN